MYKILLVLALALLLVTPSWAAPLRERGAAVTMEAVTNPNPAKDDLLLPLPCGGAMAFRAIAVQAEGFLWDLSATFGCDSCQRGSRDYYERRYGAAISGPFSLADLPVAWRAKVPRPLNGKYYYYIIGKYEVSNFQWRAIMEGLCPDEKNPLSMSDAQPKTGISWFEAVSFSEKYTEWLLKNHPEALPRFNRDSKNVGYLRLPTELEWEYAARGGHKVNRERLSQDDFFVKANSAADYAVFRPENAARIVEEPQSIGSRQPNPVGLYDTAGNVAEMTLDTFHFSVGGRLHGSAGGFVRKGGSYLSGFSEILPGRREEVAFFQDKGAARAKDLGFRLALSGINTPAGDRPSQLEAEWKVAGEGGSLLLDQGKNPLEELDRIIAASTSYTEKENLNRLRAIIKDNNIALERQNMLAAERLITTSLYMVQTLRNYALRHKLFINEISRTELQMKEDEIRGRMDEAAKRRYAQTLETLNNGRKEIMNALDASLGFYRSKVEESLAYPEKMFNEKLKMVYDELEQQDDVFSKQMLQAFTAYEKHVQLMRQGRRGQLSREMVLKDILPENLREGMNIP